MAEDLKKIEESTELESPQGWQLPPLDVQQLAIVNRYFNGRAGGTAKFTPRKCQGPDCEVASSCPLIIAGVCTPIGRDCFVETNLANQWIRAMGRALDLKPGDYFDIQTLELIVVDQLIIKRALEILSHEPLVIEAFRAMTPDGEPIIEQKPHPSVHVIKEYQKLIQDAQTSLLATRKEKSKDDARKVVSPSETLRKLQEKLRAAAAVVDKGNRELAEHQSAIDAEFVVVKPPKDG